MFYFQQQITGWEDENIPNVALQWDDNSVYALGDLVRYGNFQYKSTIEENQNNIPTDNLGITWVQWQPANDFAMLDLSSNYKTVWQTGSGYVVFKRGAKDYLAIGGFNATLITIQYLQNDNTVLEEVSFAFANNLSVYDVWTYGYGSFNTTFDNIFFQPLKKIGTNIKVIFHNAASETISCGIFVSGVSLKGGITLENISLPDRRVGNKSIKVVNFNTLVENWEADKVLTKAKENVDIPMLFIVDESNSSIFNNIAVVGKISNVSGTYNTHKQLPVTWEVEQINF